MIGRDENGIPHDLYCGLFTVEEVRLALDVFARLAALGVAHSDLLNAPAYASLMRKFGALYSQTRNGGELRDEGGHHDGE